MKFGAFTLALLSTAAVPATATGQSSSRSSVTPAVETTAPARPRLFERRVVFSTDYLNRLIATALGGNMREVTIVPPAEAASASAFARQYGIDQELALEIVRTATAEGVDPELGFRLIRVESVFHPNARGPAGALGLMQLMPSTARAIDRSLRTDAQILDPANNLRVGFRYLRRLLDHYSGDVRLALLAYNRGEGTVDRALRQGVDPENGYSAKVLGAAGELYTGAGRIGKVHPE